MADQPTAAPTQKIAAVAIGGAAATVVAWLSDVVANLDPPAAVVAALAVLFSAGVGYLTPDKDD